MSWTLVLQMVLLIRDLHLFEARTLLSIALQGLSPWENLVALMAEPIISIIISWVFEPSQRLCEAKRAAREASKAQALKFTQVTPP